MILESPIALIARPKRPPQWKPKHPDDPTQRDQLRERLQRIIDRPGVKNVDRTAVWHPEDLPGGWPKPTLDLLRRHLGD